MLSFLIILLVSVGMFLENVDSRSLNEATRSKLLNVFQQRLECTENNVCSSDQSHLEVGEETSKTANIKRRRKRSISSSNTIYLNGRIYTVDDQDWHTDPQQALVIDSGGIIRHIGTDEEAKGYLRHDSKVYDLNGKVVFPGFADVHMHPLEAASTMGGTCMLDVESPPTAFIEMLKECAPNQIGTEWVLGFGHSITQILDHIDRGGISPRLILDEAIPDTPAVMMESSSHSVWVNSEALRRAGINENTPNAVGGIIMREEGSNIPNGILFENQGIEIMDLALAPTNEVKELNAEGLQYAMNEISKRGITSICDARVYWKRDHLDAWRENCEKGYISVRAVLGLWGYPAMDNELLAEKLKELKANYSEYESDCFKVAQVKVYSDGLLESTTAKLFEQYNIDLQLPGIVGNRGMNYFDENKLTDLISRLQNYTDENGTEQGFDFHIHTIGDQGVNEALNAIERASQTSQRKPRHRLTHLELIKNSDLDRFAMLNVTADFQVSGNFTLPEHIPALAEIIGYERAERMIPVRSVRDHQGFTTFSSDWDVSEMNPLIGIQHATERGNESVTVKEAIEMYTINPAYVMRQEDITGSFVVGKYADLVVLNQDILSVNSDTISETKVIRTVLQGEIKYHDDSFAMPMTVLENVNVGMTKESSTRP